MKNIIIATLIAIILVLGFIFFTQKKSNVSYEPWPETVPARPTNNQSTQNNQTPTQNGSTTTNNNQSQIVWVESSESQLQYPSGFIVEERYTNYPGQSSSDPEANAVLEFRATRGNAVISWGGFNYECTENEYGPFVYGISQIACLNGVRTQLGVVNVRGALTQEDINIFGDFVLKNQ